MLKKFTFVYIFLQEDLQMCNFFCTFVCRMCVRVPA